MSNTTRPVNFIHFHGLTLLVVEHEGIEYLPLKPLSDLAGIDWRNTKKVAFEPDNAILFGSRWLNTPVFASPGSASTPTPEAIHIRLDRAKMYLARISTARMRSHGNADAAEVLLQLQVEWAEALHSYETHGIAIKKGHREARAELVALIKARGGSPTVAERATLTAMIADVLRELGHELPPDPQISLPGVA